MPIADPSAGTPSWLVPPWWWARAMPPFWQYFSRLGGKKSLRLERGDLAAAARKPEHARLLSIQDPI
jgi:hypothetical protein